MLITNWQKGQEKLPDIVLSWENSLIKGFWVIIRESYLIING